MRGSGPVSLWLPVVLYMAGIFAVSATPDPPMPQNVSDVSLHGAAYFGLALLLVRALAGGVWSRVSGATLVTAWIVAVAYGASDEWHQSFVPNRHADVRDLAADAIGAFAGTIAAGAWGIIRRL